MLRLHITASVLLLLLSTSIAQQRCNICGYGNTIQYPQGVVQFVYEGEPLKNNCQTWQRIVDNNPFAISTKFCINEMLQYTHNVCRCTTADGGAVEWTPPTRAPTVAPSSNAPTTVFPTTGTVSDIGAPTELPLEWTTTTLTSSSDVTTPSPAAEATIPTVYVADFTNAPIVPVTTSNAEEIPLSPTKEVLQESSGLRRFIGCTGALTWMGYVATIV